MTCDGGSSALNLFGSVSVSAPVNGSFFAVGESPVVTIRLTDNCGRMVSPLVLGTANLYLSGPRGGLATKTASKLLNCVVDRSATDRQHHFINLAAPHYAHATQSNLSIGSDGTLTYRLAAISTEAPGTYTAGVWAKTQDEVNQIFALAQFQIGTATAENYASGTATANTCFDCHLGPVTGKAYQAHTFPGFSPLGNFALDESPIASCQLCHNKDGYSLNPIVRKVHGVHRGEHQADAGVAHPDYADPDLPLGLGRDSSLAAFTNVGFPALFAKEKECTKCHVDDRWKNNPSRLACGTCHDNVFFDTGTLYPPRILGRPASGNCSIDPDCASFGGYASCDVSTGQCIRRIHFRATDDHQCTTCHTADAPGLSPISARHGILEETQVTGLKIINASLSGANGPNGTFLIGDTLSVTFQLVNNTGAIIADLITNGALSGTGLIAGPTNDPQRLIGNVNIKTTGSLTFDSVQGSYTYTFGGALPASALQPFNNPLPFNRPNNPGTYTLYLYVNKALTYQGRSYRDYGGLVTDFKLGADQPSKPRQVISNAACDSCHVQTALHGTSRRDPIACSMCHTKGAMDRTVGGAGASCRMDSNCGGSDAGWESCHNIPPDGGTGTCIIDTDPTPNTSIRLSTMVHAIHFARLRDGYSARNNLVPGTTTYVGFNNGVNNFSEILLPQDIRNCTKCHTSTRSSCTTSQTCGVGQQCKNNVCVNRSWVSPSGEVCLSCHDSAPAAAHAAVNTYQDPDGGIIESCEVCHGENSEFSVEKMHKISNPYVPPYSRERSQ